MKGFYFCSTLMWSASSEKIMETAARYGFDGVEFWAQHLETAGMDSEQVRRLKEKYGLSVIVHAKSWDLNYAALNRRIREESVREICASVDTAVLLGAEEVTVHPPRYTLKEDQAARDRAYESIGEFLDYAEERQVRISMEIMEHLPREMAVTPEGMRSIVRDMEPRLSYTVDLAHCLSEEEFFENIRRMGRVSKLHLTNKRGACLHTPLPEGDFRFERLYPELLKTGLPMVIEGYEEGDGFETLIKNITYIKQLKGEFV